VTCESTGTEVIDWSTLKRGLGKPPVTQIPTYAANPRLAKDRVIYHDTPREGIIGDEYHDRMGAAQREGCGAWEGGVHSIKGCHCSHDPSGPSCVLPPNGALPPIHSPRDWCS